MGGGPREISRGWSRSATLLGALGVIMMGFKGAWGYEDTSSASLELILFALELLLFTNLSLNGDSKLAFTSLPK